MKTKNKYLCGALAVGVTGCLYLSQCSEFRHKETNKKQPETEMISKQDSTSVDSTKIKEEQKLIGYSIIDAFKHGVVNSITEYVEKVPYDVDTINYTGRDIAIERGYYQDDNQEDEYLQFGYYDDEKGRIIVSYIKPDTISIPCLSGDDKQQIVRLADYLNSLMDKRKAHESAHQATNPNREIGKNINIEDKTEHSIFDYNTTPKETAKVFYHDELRARFFEFLYAREQFKKTGDLTIMEIEYPWYKDAIDRGYINPYSSDPKDQRKEQIFCMQNVKREFEQSDDISGYENGARDIICKHQPYNDSKEDEYNLALHDIHTYVWDGNLCYMDKFFIDGTISEFELSPLVQLTAEAKDKEHKMHTRKAESENDTNVKVDTTKTDTTATPIPALYYKSYSR